MTTITVIHEHLEKMTNFHEAILQFLDEEENNFSYIINYIESAKINKNPRKLKEILHLLSKISENHNRSHDFISKIEQILNYLKEEIKTNFTNYGIFNIFKKSKRILLFLFKEQIIFPDDIITSIISNDSYYEKYYPHYLYIEFKEYFEPFLIDKIKNDYPEIEEDLTIFDQNRKIGENNAYICELIRNDSIEKFIQYVNQRNISLHSIIKPSIFETNSFLLKKEQSLIEYALFHGSIQIFQYLLLNNVELRQSYWLQAIHGNNPEIIHILEENKIIPDKYLIAKCLKESIKCHNYNFTNYIEDQFSFNEKDQLNTNFTMCVKYFNYIGLSSYKSVFIDKNKSDIFNIFCNFNYLEIVNLLLKNKDFEIKPFEYAKEEKTVLHMAIENDDIELIQIFINEKEIDINANYKYTNDYFDFEKMTALILAIEIGNLEIVKILLSKSKINVNKEGMFKTEKTKEIETPLCRAVSLNDIDIIQLLLSHSQVDINQKSKYYHESYDSDYLEIYLQEKTALAIAIENNNHEIINILITF